MKQKKLLERILGIILTISIIITVIPTNLVAVQAANHKIYQQSYSAWKNYPYGKGGTIANTIINKGCGVLATVNAVTYLTGKELNPKAVADWAMKNGEYCTGVGSNWTIAKNSANRFGSEYGYKSCGYYSISSKVKTMPSKCTDGKTYYDYPRTSSDMRTVWNELTRHLENGETCVTLVAHHFIAIVDYDKIKDKVLVYDSYACSKRGTSSVASSSSNWKSMNELWAGSSEGKRCLKIRGMMTFFKRSTVSYKVKQINTTNVTRDSVTFNLKMNQKAPIEKVGLFFGTSEKAVRAVTEKTEHNGTGNYIYNLLAYNAEKTSTDTYSFNTKKKTQNGYSISLKSGTKYFYKMVVRVDDNWIISDINNFTTLNNPPSAVEGLKLKNQKIGRDGKATVSWKQSAYAESYRIAVKDSSGNAAYPSETNKGLNNISYTTKAMKEPGEYTIEVTAFNSSGSSTEKKIKFTVAEDVSLTFDSGMEGKPEVKKVKYNDSTKTPAAPKREGYTFNGWRNTETGKITAALTDIKNIETSAVYEAVWTANKYTVKIVDGIDNTVLQEQKEPYGSVIKMSKYYTNSIPMHKNYKFIGWSEDEFTIDGTGERIIYARYKWDSDNQVNTKINTVARASSTGKSSDGTDGYSIDVTVTAPALSSGLKNPIIRGRVVVALKTKAGRMLIETESAAFVLYTRENTETSKNINVFVPYEAATSEALASVAEVYVVNNYKSAGVISDIETDTEKIADANADEWKYTDDKSVLNESGVIKGSDEDNFVTYDITTTSTKESLNTSMPGYSLISSRWSGIVDSGDQKFVKSWPAIGNSIGKKYNSSSGVGKKIYEKYYKPESQWVKAMEDSTQKIEITDTLIDYIYYHWCCNRNNGNIAHNVTGSKYHSDASGNNYYTFHCHSLSPETNTLKQYYCSLSNIKKDVYEYDTSKMAVKDWRDKCTDSKFWIGRIPAYRRDWTLKRKIYTYSNSTTQTGLKAASMSDVPKDTSTGPKETGSYYDGKLKIYQTTDTKVSNKVQWYAYKTKVEVSHEDKNKVSDIEKSRINCISVPKYAGKNVTLYIYKNSEMSDSNTEYMGIETIDKDGNIDISDVQLREECNEKTGDLTIAIALEGETNAMIIGKIEAPKKQYMVKFNAEKETGTDGTINTIIIDKQSIEEGGSAVLPDESLIPEKEGYHFVGWSQSTVGVHDDLTVTALYEKNEYTVVYVDWENRSVEIKKTEYEGDIEIPEIPETEEGVKATWVIGDGSDKNARTLDEYVEEGNKVTSDIVVSVRYEYETYVLNVITSENPDEIEEKVEDKADAEEMIDKYSVKTETLEYGDLMQLDKYEDELSKEEDIIFYGWKNAATGEYISGNEITGDMTIYPVYEYAETTEIPTADIITGEYGSEQTVTLTSETEDAVIYYTTDGTEPKNSVTVKEYTGPVTLTKSCTLKAYACSMGRNDSESVVELYAINTDRSGTPYHIVTVYSDIAEQEGKCYQTLIKDSTLIDISEMEDVEGYTFGGLYYDENNKDVFDEKSEPITGTLNLFVHYKPIVYTVKFTDQEGNLINEQKVEYNNSANEPIPNKKEGYVFVGWDNDEYELVTDNIVCKAIYIPEKEYATISLNKSNVTTMEGMQYSKLIATISPKELSETKVAWTSNNPNVASVDEEGIVYAKSAGLAIITVTVESTGESASCTFKVVGNYQTSIVLNEKSKLGIDSQGYLREIKPESNTVEEVLAEFNNDSGNMKVYDSAGNELTKSDLVGTGAVMKLISETEELDTMTVVMTGDVDGDGHLGNIDVSKISNWLIQKEELTYEQQLAADVNGDGYVNNKDASMVSRFLVGKESL